MIVELCGLLTFEVTVIETLLPFELFEGLLESLEEFLGVGSDLGSGPRLDMRLNRLPVLSKLLDALNKELMLLF